MRLLLDTHILLWWLSDDQRLPRTAASAIGDPVADVHVSAISLAEIAIKRSLGELTVRGDLPEAIAESGFLSLPFTLEHAARLTDLPWHHRDPFDRMLIVQAMSEDLVFASVDKAFRDYAVQLLP
jgi:PIN domain nuclease of toxin-antitoxin system